MKLSMYKKIAFIVSVLLLVGACVFNIFGLIDAEQFKKIQLIFNIVACFMAGVYICLDFSKGGAFLYKLFILFIALKEGCALINMGVYESIDQWYAFALVLVCFTCPLILLLRQDLGFKNSIIVISVYLIISILCLISAIAIVPINTPDGAVLAIYNTTRVLLVLILFALMFGKYIDKTERKTK